MEELYSKFHLQPARGFSIKVSRGYQFYRQASLAAGLRPVSASLYREEIAPLLAQGGGKEEYLSDCLPRLPESEAWEKTCVDDVLLTRLASLFPGHLPILSPGATASFLCPSQQYKKLDSVETSPPYLLSLLGAGLFVLPDKCLAVLPLRISPLPLPRDVLAVRLLLIASACWPKPTAFLLLPDLRGAEAKKEAAWPGLVSCLLEKEAEEGLVVESLIPREKNLRRILEEENWWLKRS